MTSSAATSRPRRWVTPSRRFSRIFRGSGGEEDAAADKIEVSASIHLALDEFELVDLTFGLTAAPGHGQRCLDSRLILAEAGGKGFDHRGAAGSRVIQPGFQKGRRIVRGFIPGNRA